MSEIVVEYAAPLLDAAQNAEDQKKAISMAIAMWNISLLPEAEQLESLKKIESLFSTSAKVDDLSKERQKIISYLINRKKHLFQDINRFVQDYEVVDTPEGFHLNIASISLNNKEEK